MGWSKLRPALQNSIAMPVSPNGTPSLSPAQKNSSSDCSNLHTKLSTLTPFDDGRSDRLDFSVPFARLAGMPSARKYRMIMETGLVILVTRLALRVVGLPRLLSRLTYNPMASGRNLDAMEDVVYYVDRWLALFPYNQKGNCFPRALALYWFGRRAGLPVQFQCGVRKPHQHLEGHAWLMLDGREFFETSQYWKSFTVTVTYPPSPTALHTPPSESQ